MQQLPFALWIQIAGQYKSSCCSQFRDPLGVGRTKLPFELLPDPLCQGRALSAGGDGNLKIAAAYDRGVIEVARFRNVYYIAQNSAALRFLINRFVERRGCGGYDRQKRFVEIFRGEGAEFERDLACPCPFMDRGRGLQGDDVEASAGVDEAADLELADPTGADHEATFAIELQEHWE